MFSSFFRPSQAATLVDEEKVSLLADVAIEEIEKFDEDAVVVDMGDFISAEEDRITKIEFSVPQHHAALPIRPVDVLPEISQCIQLLQTSLADKKNRLSSRVREQQLRQCILGIYNVVCLLAVPGASLAVMLKLKDYLEEKALSLWNMQMAAANQNVVALDAWYKAETAKHDDVLSRLTASACYYQEWGNLLYVVWKNRIAGACSYNGENMINVDAGTKDGLVSLPDFCEVDEFDCLDGGKPWILKSACEWKARYFSCEKNDVLWRTEETKRQLEMASFENVTASYEKQQSEFFASTYKLEAEKPHDFYEPLSIAAFALTSLASSVAMFYLVKSWKNACQEYEQDLQKTFYLEDCLDSQQLMKIINLTSMLNISLKDMSMQTLISKLKAEELILCMEKLPANISCMLLRGVIEAKNDGAFKSQLEREMHSIEAEASATQQRLEDMALADLDAGVGLKL